MERTVSLLGSTGSIGRQSIDVIRRMGLKVRALAAGRSIDMLEAQAREFMPELVSVYDENAAKTLKTRLADTDIRVASGEAGLIDAATVSGADTVITAFVGEVGLTPTLAAIREHRRIALANKETLVCAGKLVMLEAEKYGAEIVPVDSEHSAIFQCLAGNNKRRLKKILLTASGGPFRGMTREEVSKMKKEQALRHPNWTMGAKITVDSSTLMNKGLEFIEAMHLFSVSPEQIEVLVHPQSVVHSMVEFTDNSVIAQIGTADMRLPIEYALTYPDRGEAVAEELDFFGIAPLTFERPDLNVFPCLRLAMECAPRTDAACAVMNAANEAAVGLYLEDRCSFYGIYDAVSNAVSSLGTLPADCIDDILYADAEARRLVLRKDK